MSGKDTDGEERKQEGGLEEVGGRGHADCGGTRETSGGFSLRPQPFSKSVQSAPRPDASDVTLPLEKPIGSRVPRCPSLPQRGSGKCEEEDEEGGRKRWLAAEILAGRNWLALTQTRTENG